MDLTDLVGDRPGWLAVAFGHDGHWTETGRYTHRTWSESRCSWPDHSDELASDLDKILAADEPVDIYFCPALRATDDRRRGSALPPTLLWADLDEPPANQEIFDTLDPLVVNSGSPGHRHAYVRLDAPIDLGTFNTLMPALRDALGADHKITDNDLLRLPGSRNHKTSPPQPVHVDSGPGRVWTAAEVAALLGVDLNDHPDVPRVPNPTVQAEHVDLDTLPSTIRNRLDQNTPTDASAAFHGLVAACRDAGLTQGQTLTVVDSWGHTPPRYRTRLAAEVNRCWRKLTLPLHELATTDPPTTNGYDPNRLEDAHLAQRLANEALTGRFCWAAGLGWLRWDGRRWKTATDKTVNEAVRRAVITLHADEAKAGADAHRLRQLSGLLSAHRIRALTSLACGILEADADTFDQQPDLLNVGNGVVNLTTGELRRHDPALRLTKITQINYKPDAAHSDWTVALAALPEAVANWMQVRIGQAATGYMTPDDLLLVCQGGGSNGKTTLLGSITNVLGDHAVNVSERVLLANPGDHPTELMGLFGARLALVEETPEARHLSVKRLKDTIGTPTMTARRIRQDTVTWPATHSLILTSNYAPRVDETDRGTWRRLALVRFPRTYTGTHADPGLRERLKAGANGQHEAILAWIIAGARRWYNSQRVMPPAPEQVTTDTAQWRADADQVYAYLADRLMFDPTAAILATELHTDFNDWLTSRGANIWSDQTFVVRFGGHSEIEHHNVAKTRTRDLTGLSRRAPFSDLTGAIATVWRGVRFRDRSDDETDLCRGVQGVSDTPREEAAFKVHQEPLHTPAHPCNSSELTHLVDNPAQATHDTITTIRGPICPTCGYAVDIVGHAAGCIGDQP